MNWCVAMTKPGAEGIAALNLHRQGYTTYLPKYVIKPPGRKPAIRCLFPRYIFIFVDQIWYSITGTVGVSRLLMTDGKPAVLAESIIRGLKDREHHGLVSLTPKERFQHGASVKIADGSFSGYSLTYDGMTSAERVRVLIEMLGRKVPIELSEKALVAA